jgi:5-methylthioadenosine/S-adenosylhomocysteine deaminase
MPPRRRDTFERAYTESVLEPIPDEPAPLGRPLAGVAPAQPVALKGCVIAGGQVHDPGYVVVSGTDVVKVSGGPTPPSGVEVFDTGGVILPGLIDLHGHPEYNIFAAWEPPTLYENRYKWRDSPEYAEVVKKPWDLLTEEPRPPAPPRPSLLAELTRYAEVRALVGGVTAIQGAKYRRHDEPLVRNVDLRIFGQQKARTAVDLQLVFGDRHQALRAGLADGSVSAFYVHLAEGKRGDQASRAEFDDLVAKGLLAKATVVIHGTALTDAQLGDLHDAGAKLVWSPQSNLRLYGETTRAARALDLGIPVGLGADWLPSGSASLLAEMKVARNALAAQGKDVGAKKLVEMVTVDAAGIAGLSDFLGTLAPGRPADLLVLERRMQDPWENVAAAMPWWVDLVMIGGDMAYGRTAWIRKLANLPAANALETAFAWGKEMTLDTTYSVRQSGTPPPRLSVLRASLLGRYRQIGPIFA